MPNGILLEANPEPGTTGQVFGPEVAGIWAFAWKGYSGGIDIYLHPSEEDAWAAAADGALQTNTGDQLVRDLYDAGRWREVVRRFNEITPDRVCLDVRLAMFTLDGEMVRGSDL